MVGSPNINWSWGTSWTKYDSVDLYGDKNIILETGLGEGVISEYLVAGLSTIGSVLAGGDETDCWDLECYLSEREEPELVQEVERYQLHIVRLTSVLA